MTVVNWRNKRKTPNKESVWRRWQRFGRDWRVNADRGSLNPRQGRVSSSVSLAMFAANLRALIASVVAPYKASGVVETED
jgi:hypothetical protein